MQDSDVEIAFIDEVNALDYETEDGWRLGSHDLAPTSLVLQARTEAGAPESRGLAVGACYSFAIWTHGPFSGVGSTYLRGEPQHRVIVENGALPSIWYVKYEAGILGMRAQWKFLGRSRQHSEDPDKFRHSEFEKFHTRARKGGVAEEFILRYVRGTSLGSRIGGSMGGSWAWPPLPELLRHR